jgi:hypothetical protein
MQRELYHWYLYRLCPSGDGFRIPLRAFNVPLISFFKLIIRVKMRKRGSNLTFQLSLDICTVHGKAEFGTIWEL